MLCIFDCTMEYSEKVGNQTAVIQTKNPIKYVFKNEFIPKYWIDPDTVLCLPPFSTTELNELVISTWSECSGQPFAQNPNSFWFTMWFPSESTLVEHHLLEGFSWSTGQPVNLKVDF